MCQSIEENANETYLKLQKFVDEINQEGGKLELHQQRVNTHFLSTTKFGGNRMSGRLCIHVRAKCHWSVGLSGLGLAQQLGARFEKYFGRKQDLMIQGDREPHWVTGDFKDVEWAVQTYSEQGT